MTSLDESSELVTFIEAITTPPKPPTPPPQLIQEQPQPASENSQDVAQKKKKKKELKQESIGEDQLSGFGSEVENNIQKDMPKKKLQQAFAQRFKQTNDDRDSKISSLKGDSKYGMFNHDIPLSPKGYDYSDNAYKGTGFKGGSVGSDHKTLVGDTMASIDHNKGSNDKPHLVSPDINSGSVHILKGSQINIESDFTQSVDINSP